MTFWEIKMTNELRYFPATIYVHTDVTRKKPLLEERAIQEQLHLEGKLLVTANDVTNPNREGIPFHGIIYREEIQSITSITHDSENINLDMIMSLSEAAEKWRLADGSSIRKAIERGKFKHNEVKRCGSVWIITYPAMQRVFGPIVERANDYTISYTEFYQLLSLVQNQDFFNRAKAFLTGKKHKINFAESEHAQRLKTIVAEAFTCLEHGGRVIAQQKDQQRPTSVKQVYQKKEELIALLVRNCEYLIMDVNLLKYILPDFESKKVENNTLT